MAKKGPVRETSAKTRSQKSQKAQLFGSFFALNTGKSHCKECPTRNLSVTGFTSRIRWALMGFLNTADPRQYINIVALHHYALLPVSVFINNG